MRSLGVHVPIMVQEVLDCLRPVPGEAALDCTLGAGGHAQAILTRLQPGGRLIGLDVDPIELPRTETRLRDVGFGPDVFVARHANFADLLSVCAAEDLEGADLILADLGVSAMQFDEPERGFSYKVVGPLDMRMNPQRGESAAQLIVRLSEPDLSDALQRNADEPHAALIARLLKQQPCTTTHEVERRVRTGLHDALPNVSKADVKMSLRRTFQALRIAVNDEFAALDAFLQALPACLSPGGRVAVITFHSGEDRRVKKGVSGRSSRAAYSDIAHQVVRSTKDETFSNRRAAAAKLRWAVRASKQLEDRST